MDGLTVNNSAAVIKGGDSVNPTDVVDVEAAATCRYVTVEAPKLPPVSSFTVTGGTADTDYSYANETLTIKTGTALTIANKDPATATTDKIAVPADVTANLTLAGVNIDVSTVEGACAFNVPASATANITLASDTTNTLKSGKNSAGMGGISAQGGGTIHINGDGKLLATGGQDGAGIGGGASSADGTGADGAGGTVTISGNAEVTANGDNNSAGIGGGNGGAGGTVTISGNAKVTATGGIVGGAGIGGGVLGKKGTTTISDNATVIAAAGKQTFFGHRAMNGLTVNNPTAIIKAGNSADPTDVVDVETAATCRYVTVEVPKLPVSSFTVTGGTADTDYSYANETLTIKTDTALTIANKDPATATTDKIAVPADVTANLTLAGVNIDVSTLDYSCAFNVPASATANITLAPDTTNTLKSGVGAAGLGGGPTDLGGGTIHIDGDGKLSAASNGKGAGIGSGARGANGTVTISGNAEVIAAGGWGGAGIGGGCPIDMVDVVAVGGAGGVVTISGNAQVTANSYFDAAGIGGGYRGAGGTVIIGGNAKVTATGDGCGVGIGGSAESSAGTTTINDNATVIAAAGKNAYWFERPTIGGLTVNNSAAVIKGGDYADPTDVVTVEAAATCRYVTVEVPKMLLEVDLDGTGSGAAVQYASFEDGWNAAAGSGNTANTTVKLLEDWVADTTTHYFGTGDGFDSGAIKIPEGKTITLDLNGKTIDRGLTTGRTTGYVVLVKRGFLTLNDTAGGGKITGGKVTGDVGGGGVYVSGGSFTLNGGAITGNTAPNGGGVLNTSGTTFTMNNGTISENTAVSSGGGVATSGTFKMNGGTITGNTAANGGGVDCSPAGSCTFGSGSKITITGNKKTAGDVNNLYLRSGRVAMISGALAEGSSIGVTAGGTAPVAITGTNAADYSGYFTSDNANYIIYNEGTGSNQTVMLGAASKTPTAEDFDVTLPERAAYDAKPHAATAAWKTTVTGGGAITVEYQKSGTTTWSSTAPTDAGGYDVRLNVAKGDKFAGGIITNSWQIVIDTASVTTSDYPTASAISYGDALRASALTGGKCTWNGQEVPGTFTWANPDEKPAVGAAMWLTFTPDNSNFGVSTMLMNANVSPKELAVVWNGADAAYTYNGADQSASVTAGVAAADLVNGDTATKVPVTVAFAPTEFKNAGKYTLTATTNNQNYKLTNATKAITIKTKTIAGVSPAVTAPSAAAAPQTSIAQGEGYTGTITWAPAVTAKFGYNTAYTATVVLTPDNNHSFTAATTATGWATSYNTSDGKLTLTQQFTPTAKAKVTGIAVTAPATFAAYYADFDAVKAGNKLPTTATVTTESGNLSPALTWSCESYNAAPGASNTFTWAITEADLANYDLNGKVTTGTTQITNKAATDVTITGKDGTAFYNPGEEYNTAGLFTVDKNAGTPTYTLLPGGTGTGTVVPTTGKLAATKAGTFKIKIDTAATGNYAAGTAIATVTLSKAQVALPTVASKTYNGKKQTAEVAANPYYTVKTNNGGTDAGKYDVVLALNDTNLFCWKVEGNPTTDQTLTFTINIATDNTVTDLALAGWTYGETANTPTATAKYGTPVFTYSDTENGTYTATVPTAAGTYWVKATAVGTASYTTALATKEFTIAPATQIVTDAGYTGVYDGAAHGITVTADKAATIQYRTAATGDYTLAANPTYTNVGTYTVYYQVTRANYSPVTGSKTVAITAKALTATATADNKPYDGTTKATGTISLAGLVGKDKVTATGAFAFDTAGAGTGKTVNVTGITLAGDSKANYTVNATATAKANVTQAPTATDTVAWPAGLTLTSGKKLTDLTLPTDKNGTFRWENSDATPSVGSNVYTLIFTPSDPNYAPVSKQISVMVSEPERKNELVNQNDKTVSAVAGLEEAAKAQPAGSTTRLTIAAEGFSTESSDQNALRGLFGADANQANCIFISAMLQNINAAGEMRDIGDTNAAVLTLTIKLARTDVPVKLARMHKGTAALLTQVASTDNPQDGTYYVDVANGSAYVYASKYSVYAVYYGSAVTPTPTPTVAPTPAPTAAPTVAPTTAPAKDEHPEIGAAKANGTWGSKDGTATPAPTAKAQAPAAVKGKVPATGDTFPVVLLVVLLLCAGGLLVIFYLRRKKSNTQPKQ